MKNILDYVKEYQFTFEEKPLNELDYLVFSWISYYHIPSDIYKEKSFKTIKLKDLYRGKYLSDMTVDVFDIPKSTELLSLIAMSERFREIDITYYYEILSKKITKQFSAMTFIINKNLIFVAFRGTDHSFVGWKEDFDMAFTKNIPSQLEAKSYLESISKKFNSNMIVGGHSKGGNLALYSSAFVNKKIQNRIKSVYSFDGPALRNDLTDTNEYKSIEDKIIKFVPQSSVVGMLFENSLNYKIISSNTISVLQHNPFSWEIDKTKLKSKQATTKDSVLFKNGINAVITDLSDEHKKMFVNSLYEVVEKTNADTVEEFNSNIIKNIPILISSFNELNESKKQIIFDTIKVFIKNTK